MFPLPPLARPIPFLLGFLGGFAPFRTIGKAWNEMIGMLGPWTGQEHVREGLNKIGYYPLATVKAYQETKGTDHSGKLTDPSFVPVEIKAGSRVCEVASGLA